MTHDVALVFVSHSPHLAQGIVDLCAQMAPDVVMVPAGGIEDGSLGTSFDTISDAIERAAGFVEDHDGPLRDVVVFADLGSAVLSTQSVLEFLPAELDGRITLAQAPFVEGGVAGSVAAAQGAGAAEVVRRAHQAASELLTDLAHDPTPAAEITEEPGTVSSSVTVSNALGLHARPAAVLARLIAGFDAQVTLNGANGSSVIDIMKLGATGGQALTVVAQGNQAQQAHDAVVEAIAGGFGEAEVSSDSLGQ